MIGVRWWALVDADVLGEVVLDGGDDGLHELEEHDEVAVHAQLAAALRHRLDYLLHHLRVPGNVGGGGGIPSIMVFIY